MGLRIVFAAICIFINVSAQAAETITGKTIVWVEPGDTYLGLFGTDWMKVYQANNKVKLFDGKGEVASPDKLVVGQKLMIPPDNHLTLQTMEKLSRYKNVKNAAMKALQEAKELKDKIPHAESASYKEATALLRKAEEAVKGVTYSFGNYVEAKKLALEAYGLLRITEERLADRKNMEMLAAIVLIAFSGFVWVGRYKKRKERAKHAVSWIKKHQERLEKIRNTEKSQINVTAGQ